MRIRLRLAYQGTRYHGWQIQTREPDGSTVQGQLERCLARLCGAPVRAFGSGRTDSGVHELAQHVHFDVEDAKACAIPDWRRTLNAMLPRDIRVLEAGPCAADFHVRFSAASKTYRYRFWQERGFVPPYDEPYVWTCGPLDVQPMRQGLALLWGRHDFASFANAGTDMEDTVREIFAISLHSPASAQWLPEHAPELVLTIKGSGFLKQMVRNIAGLAADLGRGRLAPEDVSAILAAADRKCLPSATAPAKGLCLVAVDYPEQCLRGSAEKDALRADTGENS